MGVSVEDVSKDTKSDENIANRPFVPSEDDIKKDELERPQWGNQIEFILSTIGYAVGLGNVWRFPYLVYKYGGGTFLIPYVFMLFFVGLPIFFMELALGQYCGLGTTKVFGNLAPIFKGLGPAMVSCSFLVCLYYNVILAWTLFYLFTGMKSELPWTPEGMDCGSTNTPACYANMTPAEAYFKYDMLGIRLETTWDKFGGMQWQMVVCLLGAWIIVCLCLIKGIQSAGKVVYFTAVFPFVVLIILFGYGLSKWSDGAKEGIEFYLLPDAKKLLEVEVWYQAAIQIFYSLGVASGGLITLASYNKFDSNCYRDALLVSFINCGTSFFAGFVVFSILGFMAHQTHRKIKDVVMSGEALAFIAYPEAVGHMPYGWAQLMSFLFFSMLLTLGLDSMFTMLECVLTAIFDHFKQLVPYKPFVVITVCAICFLLGLSMCADGGLFMFQLFNDNSMTWNVLLFAIIQVLIVSWSYGADNFLRNIEEMKIKFPKAIRMYWKICWQFITPLVLIIITIVSFAQTKPQFSEVYRHYEWPNNIQALCWLMPLSTVLFIPIVGIYQIFRLKSINKPLTMETLIRKTPSWKPSPDSARVIEAENLLRDGERDTEGENNGKTLSRRASRVSFRRHLPENYEHLI